MIKRIDCYVCSPVSMDLVCPKCKGVNIAWSEWEKHIWCYDCNLDVEYKSSGFGPVPMEMASMLGLDLRRYNIESGDIVPNEINKYYKPLNNVYTTPKIK